MKKCCAFGHRELYQNIDKELKSALINLIENDGVTVLMTGGNGQLDRKFLSIQDFMYYCDYDIHDFSTFIKRSKVPVRF